MRFLVLVSLLCICIGYMSSASPLTQSLRKPLELGDDVSNIHDVIPPSPTPDTMNKMFDVFKGGMSIDKVIALFKTFRLGTTFFKSFIEDVPLANKIIKDLAKRNTEVRVLTKYWIDGKFPDLKDIFDVVTAKHRDFTADVGAVLKNDQQLAQFRELVRKGNQTNSKTLNEILLLFYGKKVSLKASELTAQGAISLNNALFLGKFLHGLKVENIFGPMFLSSGYNTVLKYLLSVNYSYLLQLHALPQNMKGGKYTVIGGNHGGATDPLVAHLMQDIRGKYTQLLKGNRTNMQVENAVYDILDQLLNIIKRERDELNHTIARVNGTTIT